TELLRLPPMLVRLLSADAPVVPSCRYWLERVEGGPIFRRTNTAGVRRHTPEVGVDDPYASPNHVLLRLTPPRGTLPDPASRHPRRGVESRDLRRWWRAAGGRAACGPDWDDRAGPDLLSAQGRDGGLPRKSDDAGRPRAADLSSWIRPGAQPRRATRAEVS